MSGTKIIDVSKWQGNIDWAAAKTDVGLAILRVQDGATLDTRIDENIKGCKQHGIPYGVYAFFRSSTPAQAVREMEVFMKRTKEAGGGALFYVIDCETDGPNKQSIRAAVNYLLAQGVKVGIYFAHHKYPVYGGDYGQHFTWLPRYGGKHPKYPCDLWQFTSKGDVRGIDGHVDLNMINNHRKPLAWYVKKQAKVPPAKPVRKPDKVYTVKPGDTLAEIAARHRVTWRALQAHNHIKNANLIYPGQKIKIPQK